MLVYECIVSETVSICISIIFNKKGKDYIFIMRTNYHTHTPHCGHALGESTAEYAAAAFIADIKILGFTDHAPFENHDFGCRMTYDVLNTYFEEVEQLQKEYASKMTILKSLEIEYLPEYAGNKNYYEWLLNDKKLDYLLLGEHFFRDKNNELFNIYNIPAPELILEYAKACCEAMHTGYYKILAHPDLFGVNQFAWGKIQDEASDMIIENAIKNNVILEFNANGFRRGIHEYPDGNRYMYPLDNFWNMVKASGAKVIVSSDTHNPNEIWDHAMTQAYEYLDKLNISPLEKI